MEVSGTQKTRGVWGKRIKMHIVRTHLIDGLAFRVAGIRKAFLPTARGHQHVWIQVYYTFPSQAPLESFCGKVVSTTELIETFQPVMSVIILGHDDRRHQDDVEF